MRAADELQRESDAAAAVAMEESNCAEQEARDRQEEQERQERGRREAAEASRAARNLS